MTDEDDLKKTADSSDSCGPSRPTVASNVREATEGGGEGDDNGRGMKAIDECRRRFNTIMEKGRACTERAFQGRASLRRKPPSRNRGGSGAVESPPDASV